MSGDGTAASDSFPCGHETRTIGCGGCDPAAIEFVIDDATGRMWRFCCMERDQYGECGHAPTGDSRPDGAA